MKKLFIISTGFLLIVSLFNCKKTDDNFLPGVTKQEYHGTADIVISYYDYNPYTGQDVFIEEKHYNYNVFVYINTPMKSGGITETNPFNLQISPDRNNSDDEEGNIDISSCMIFSVSTGYVLLQYWDYVLTGEQISGTLKDNHAAEASAANIIWAWEDVAGIVMTMPFAIANGANIAGVIDANTVALTITGQSTDTYRKFSCQINAVEKK